MSEPSRRIAALLASNAFRASALAALAVFAWWGFEVLSSTPAPPPEATPLSLAETPHLPADAGATESHASRAESSAAESLASIDAEDLWIATEVSAPFARVVDDATGAPVSGAVVEVFDHRVRWMLSDDSPVLFAQPFRTVRSSGDGSLHAPRSWRGEIWLRAVNPTGASFEPVQVPLPAHRSHPLVELRVVQGVEVRGVVRDDEQRPATGGTVYAVPGMAELIRGGKLASHLQISTPILGDGSFVFASLKPGTGWAFVAVLEGGLRSKRLTVALGSEPVMLELRSPPASSIEGIVVDADGRPIAGAEIVCGQKEPDDRPPRELEWIPRIAPKTTTDTDGRFALGGLETDQYDLVIAHDGYLRPDTVAIRVKDGERRSDVRVTLERGQRLGGRVVDESGRAVAGAHVRCLEASRTTDAAGRFEFNCMPLSSEPRNFDGFAYVRAKGYRPQSFDLPWRLDHEHVLVLSLPRPRPLRLRVVDDASDAPVPRFRVDVDGLDSDDLDGTFEVEQAEGRFDVPPMLIDGTRLDVIAADRVMAEVLCSDAMLATGEAEVRLERSKFLHGVVVDTKGSAVPEALVSLADAESETVRTDALGRFRLAGAAKHEIRVDHPSFVRREGLFENAGLTGVRVELMRAGRIAGRVVDPRGRPISKLFVLASPVSFDSIRDATAMTETDAEGRYELLRLQPTDYTVRAVLRDAELEAWSAGASEVNGANVMEDQTTTVDLVLDPPELASLRGRVHLAGQPVARALVFAHRVDGADWLDASPRLSSVRTDDAGVFELEDVVCGEVMLRVVHGDRLDAIFTFKHEQGQNEPLVLELPSAEVEVLVLDPSGGPLASGAVVRLDADRDESELALRVSEGEELRAKLEVGRHRFLGVPPGQYRVHVGDIEGDAPLALAAPAEILVAPHAATLQVEVRLAPAYRIKLEVVDAMTRGPIEWCCACRILHPTRKDWANSDGPGQLVFDDAAARPCEVWVGSETHIPKRLRFDVPRGGTKQRIELEPGARVHFVVQDAEGRPVRGARVVLTRVPGEPALEPFPEAWHRPIEDEESGAFDIATLAPGHYAARAELGTQSSGEIEFTVPASGTVDVVLPLR